MVTRRAGGTNQDPRRAARCVWGPGAGERLRVSAGLRLGRRLGTAWWGGRPAGPPVLAFRLRSPARGVGGVPRCGSAGPASPGKAAPRRSPRGRRCGREGQAVRMWLCALPLARPRRGGRPDGEERRYALGTLRGATGPRAGLGLLSARDAARGRVRPGAEGAGRLLPGASWPSLLRPLSAWLCCPGCLWVGSGWSNVLGGGSCGESRAVPVQPEQMHRFSIKARHEAFACRAGSGFTRQLSCAAPSRLQLPAPDPSWAPVTRGSRGNAQLSSAL